jgi:hypothetical protein
VMLLAHVENYLLEENVYFVPCANGNQALETSVLISSSWFPFSIF